MAEIKRSILFGKLNSLGYKAMEGATVFCKMRGNPYVETHPLAAPGLANTRTPTCTASSKHFGLDASRVAADFMAALDKLPRGATAISDFSPHLEESVERGWTYASLLFGDEQRADGPPHPGHSENAWVAQRACAASRGSSRRSKPRSSSDSFGKIVARLA